MEGHALAQEADVQLLTRVSLQPLADDLAGEVPAQLQNGTHQLATDDTQRSQADGTQRIGFLLQGVKGNTDQDGYQRCQRGVAKGTDNHQQDERFVAEYVRDHPANRGAAIRVNGGLYSKFGQRDYPVAPPNRPE